MKPGHALGHQRGILFVTGCGVSNALNRDLGVGAGGRAEALIGRRMDRQADGIRQQIESTEVERVAEGIEGTFTSGILVATNSADLQPAARAFPSAEEMQRPACPIVTPTAATFLDRLTSRSRDT